MPRLNEERMIQASGAAWLHQAVGAPPPGAPAPKVGDMAQVGFPIEPETFGLVV